MNYYNENDSKAAAWLRELIARGLIAPGIVDERSIEDVTPADLAGFRQCHFFAGIGGWSHALRLAGWADDLPVWTGSCPCQPFSQAGSGKGTDDPRHLWPAFRWLIDQCRPPVVFGEQVASLDGRFWLAAVRADLEAMGYAVGAADLCAAGVGAPHIRQRLYFAGVADDERQRREMALFDQRIGSSAVGERQANEPGVWRAVVGLEHGIGKGLERFAGDGDTIGQPVEAGSATTAGYACGLADSNGRNPGAERQQRSGEQRLQSGGVGDGGLADSDCRGPQQRYGTTTQHGHGCAAHADGGNNPRGGEGIYRRSDAIHGGWSAPDWLLCTDGKWRPVESGSFPLAHGVPARMGRLRGYGNAIVPQVAELFIRATINGDDI